MNHHDQPCDSRKCVIAIDGPGPPPARAHSPGGWLQHSVLPHLDTGLTYRAVAGAMLEQGHALDDEAAALHIARKIDLGALDREKLATHEIGEAASRVAVMSRVRGGVGGGAEDLCGRATWRRSGRARHRHESLPPMRMSNCSSPPRRKCVPNAGIKSGWPGVNHRIFIPFSPICKSATTATPTAKTAR